LLALCESTSFCQEAARGGRGKFLLVKNGYLRHGVAFPTIFDYALRYSHPLQISCHPRRAAILLLIPFKAGKNSVLSEVIFFGGSSYSGIEMV
jgi:hypothetical protein